MSWTNYHTHTHYCDGSHAPIEYLKQAIHLGMKAYGFSSHGPVPFKSPWNIKNEDITKYANEIHTLKNTFGDKIQIYLGFEMDFIPGKMGPNHPAIADCAVDYTVGSIHYIDTYNDGTAWNIDGFHEEFIKGLHEIFNNNIKNAITRYYELTIEMLETDKPDILGHLDKIKMQNIEQSFFKEDETWYRAMIDKLIQTIRKSNVMVEINTRGFYKKGDTAFYPSNWIIEKLIEADIPLVLNADSHQPKEITAGYHEAVKQLKNMGLKKLYALVDGAWQAFSFNKKGLVT